MYNFVKQSHIENVEVLRFSSAKVLLLAKFHGGFLKKNVINFRTCLTGRGLQLYENPSSYA